MAYTKILFQDSPSTATPLNAQNLNHMDDQIALNDQRLTDLEGAHVSSFNGRTGAVTPSKGDYDIGQIAPLTGAQVGQVPVVVNVGTEENPELEFQMGAGGGGGHVIQNASGTDMAQESAMQFPDSHVSDDSINGRTVVENIKEVLPADYDSTTDEGIIVCDDGNGVPIGEIEEDYVEVDVTTSMTYADAFALLFADVDLTKITDYSYIDILGSLFILTNNSSTLKFTNMNGASNRASMDEVLFNGTNAYFYNYNLYAHSRTDNTNENIWANGKISLYYGTSSTVINLKTSADYCQYDENTTVKQAIDEIDAKIAVINDYTPSTVGGSKDIAFPNGFTMTNSVILTVSINLGNVVFTSATTGNYLYAMYKSNGTGISLGLINDAPSGATNKAVKIVLMKIS